MYYFDIDYCLVDELFNEESHPAYLLSCQVLRYLFRLLEGIHYKEVELGQYGFDYLFVGAIDHNQLSKSAEFSLGAYDFEFVGSSNLVCYLLKVGDYFLSGMGLYLSLKLSDCFFCLD